MEQKDSYTPFEVAQMIYASNKVHKGPTTTEEIERYESIVPENVREAEHRLGNWVRDFYQNNLNVGQKPFYRKTKGFTNRTRFYEIFKNL